jgi:hypothetical protein
MFVLICNRVVKMNTGATAKFAPRSANQTMLTVSGPFTSYRVAQRAMLTTLGTHTCLDAQVWTEDYVRKQQTKGNRAGEQTALDAAVKLLNAVEDATTAATSAMAN